MKHALRTMVFQQAGRGGGMGIGAAIREMILCKGR